MKRQRVYQAQEKNCPCSAGTLFRPHQAAIIVGHWARVPSDQTELCSFISRILAHLLFSYFPFPCQPFSHNLWKVTLWRPPRLHTWILKFPEIFSIDQRMKYLHANAWYFVHVLFHGICFQWSRYLHQNALNLMHVSHCMNLDIGATIFIFIIYQM